MARAFSEPCPMRDRRRWLIVGHGIPSAQGYMPSESSRFRRDPHRALRRWHGSMRETGHRRRCFRAMRRRRSPCVGRGHLRRAGGARARPFGQPLRPSRRGRAAVSLHTTAGRLERVWRLEHSAQDAKEADVAYDAAAHDRSGRRVRCAVRRAFLAGDVAGDAGRRSGPIRPLGGSRSRRRAAPGCPSRARRPRRLSSPHRRANVCPRLSTDAKVLERSTRR